MIKFIAAIVLSMVAMSVNAQTTVCQKGNLLEQLLEFGDVKSNTVTSVTETPTTVTITNTTSLRVRGVDCQIQTVNVINRTTEVGDVPKSGEWFLERLGRDLSSNATAVKGWVSDK